MILIVTGTPGTGKTATAESLAKALGYTVIDLNTVIADNNLVTDYDTKRGCDIVDEDQFVTVLTPIIKNGTNLIIDGHLSHEIPKELVDCCIVTKCDLPILEKRLAKRGYNDEKIRENLDSEIFDVCLTEATANNHTIVVVETNGPLEMDHLIASLPKH